MKKLDRYVLGSFLKNYLISLVVLVGLYVLLDIVFNFDEFTRYTESVGVRGVIWGMTAYYAPRTFVVYTQLAGVIPVMAAAFTLMRMSRFNELTALLAAGISLLRVAAPVILVGVGINLVLQPINQELIIPNLAPYIAQDRGDSIETASTGQAVRAMPDGTGGRFDAVRYHVGTESKTPWVETLTFVERGEEGDIARMVAASRGDWDARERVWRLTDGREVSEAIGNALVLPDATPSPVQSQTRSFAQPPSATGKPVEVLKTEVTPAEIELFLSASGSVGLGGSYFDLLSTSQINQLLARPRQYATASLLRARHLRISTYVMNVVLMLLAIPAVLTRQPGQLKRAAGKTLTLVGAAMATVFICQMLAKDPPSPEWTTRWPALMAWMPVFLFGPIAVLMLDRIET